jgi:hypothetical protein
LVIGFLLSGVGLAKTDDTDATSDWGEAQYMQALVQESDRDKSGFGVDFSGVLVNQR